MRCDDMRKRLPEYMDGALDAKTLLEAEKHLFSCPRCRKELEGLKALGQKLSSLKKVAAPDDFLEKVHGRIKEANEFNRMMRSLFAPSRIRIPRVAIGAIAMVVAGVALFKVVSITMPLVAVNEAPKGADTFLMRKAAVTEKVYAIKPAAPPDISKAEVADARQMADISLKRSVKPEPESRVVMAGKAAVQEHAQSAAALSAAPEKPSADNITAGKSAPPALPDLASRIGKIAEGLGGKLISEEQGTGSENFDGAGTPVLITVEIPADKYDILVNDLANLGKFEVSPEKPDYAPAGSIRLKIKPLAVTASRRQ